MQSEITFTLKDFGFTVFWTGLTVAIWYVVLILRKVYITIKDVSGIIEENRERIDLIMEEVPQITKNVEEITTEVSHDIQVFRPTVDNIADTSESITDVIKENQSITDSITSFFNVLTTVKKTLDKFNQKISKDDIE